MKAIEAVKTIEDCKKLDKPLADLIREFQSIVCKEGKLPEDTKQLLMNNFRDSYNMELSDFFSEISLLLSEYQYHLTKALENTELNGIIGGAAKCGK